jgi:15-cis-phytoene synthase
MSPQEYCQQKAAGSGSSFYYSFLFLPQARREAITALYAFCREVDDAVDEPSDAGVARARIAWWRDEVNRLYKGDGNHPVSKALEPCLKPFNITAKNMHAVIDGMEMDLEQTRYLDYPGLALYCERVAGVVGLMASEIFGKTQESTLEYARQLGHAFQMTNIIRDVGEDARRGRIYLPIDEMQRFQVPAHEILNAKHSERFVALMQFQTERARELYRKAYSLLPEADRRSQRPGLMMAAIYSTLLQEIERDGYQVLNQRTSLTPIRKLWLAWKTFVRARPLALPGI